MHNSKKEKTLISYGEMFNFSQIKKSSRKIWIKMPKLINYLAQERMHERKGRKFVFMIAKKKKTKKKNERNHFGNSSSKQECYI